MLLQSLYIIAFSILAILAIVNMVRNLFSLGFESQRPYSTGASHAQTPPHPEFFDETGKVINEPLLVMRSMSVDDARDHLNALYESSPGSSSLNTESREEP